MTLPAPMCCFPWRRHRTCAVSAGIGYAFRPSKRQACGTSASAPLLDTVNRPYFSNKNGTGLGHLYTARAPGRRLRQHLSRSVTFFAKATVGGRLADFRPDDFPFTAL